MSRFAVVLALSWTLSSGRAAETPSLPLAVPLVKAPPWAHVQPPEGIPMGMWDDVYGCPQADVLVLRRGPAIYSFPAGSAARETLVATDPRFENARFYRAVGTKDRVWIFMERRRRERLVMHGAKDGGERVEAVREGPGGAPLALELGTKKLVEFLPTGVKMREDQQLGIDAAPVHGGALVIVDGGDPATWPEKTTIYCVTYWFDLSTGKTVQLPLCWSSYYYSGDLKWAVLQRGSPSGYRILMGVNMATGEIVKSGLPDWEKAPWVEYTSVTRPLSPDGEPVLRARPRFAPRVVMGISSEGRVVPWKMALEESHSPTVKAADGWAALHVPGRGSVTDTRSLWFAPLDAGAEPRRLSDQVRDYEVLGSGRCLFTATSTGRKGNFFSASFETYVYEDRKNAVWNVLDGLLRLEPLSAELAAKPYVEDRMSVRLLRSFGSPARASLVLASFDHFRHDMRSSPIGFNERAVQNERWRQEMVVSGDGRRFALDLPEQKFDGAEQLWLHNSGTLIRAVPRTMDSAAGRAGGLEVSRIALDLK